MPASYETVCRLSSRRYETPDTNLLFCWRELRRLVVAELRLDKYKRKVSAPPLTGIILCAAKHQGRIELLERDKTSIQVAEYLTALPPKDVLQRKLQEAAPSRKRIADKTAADTRTSTARARFRRASCL